jgi:hypothetical protein
MKSGGSVNKPTERATKQEPAKGHSKDPLFFASNPCQYLFDKTQPETQLESIDWSTWCRAGGHSGGKELEEHMEVAWDPSDSPYHNAPESHMLRWWHHKMVEPL